MMTVTKTEKASTVAWPPKTTPAGGAATAATAASTATATVSPAW